MVSTLIQANDCLFQVKVGDDWLTALCFKSFTVTVTTDEKEITTVGDGAYKAYDYKVLSWTAALNGGMRIPDGISITNFDFVEYQQGFIPVEFRAAWIDPSGDIRTFKGMGIIKTNNLVANSSQIADANVDILGSGEFEIGDSLDEFINLTMIITGNNSAPVFFKFWLLNDLGDTIFLTDTLPQASGSMLDNPLNLTVPVPKGTWYFYYYVDTNTVGNTINVTAPPTYSANFNNGITQFNTYPNTLYDFTADRTVTVTLGINNPPPTCVPPSIIGSPFLPDATEGVPYSVSIPIQGSPTFNLTNITKPSWMVIQVITVSGQSYLNFTGTPDVTGTSIPVSVDINNACGSFTYSDTIDVDNNPNLITINYDYTEPGSGSGASCGFAIFKNGVQVFGSGVTVSGSLTANPGEIIEAHIVGNALGSLKELEASDNVTGVLDTDSSTGSIVSVSFSLVVGRTYQITGTVTNT